MFANADSEAAKDLTRVFKAPFETGPREALVRRYHERGFERISELYSASVGVVRGRDFTAPLSAARFRWLCPGRTESTKSLVKEISLRVAAGDASAVLSAEKGLAEQPRSCELLVEWSRAYLQFSVLPSVNRDATKEEMAVRILVTLGDDGHVQPSGLEGSAPIYQFLADFFSAREDYVTAVVMASASEQRLNDGSLTGSESQGSFRSGLARRIKALKTLATRGSAARFGDR